MLIYTVAALIFIIPPAFVLFPLVFDNTVIHAILQFYLPESWMGDQIINKIACSSYVAFHGTLVVIQPIHLLVSFMLVFVESKHLLATSYVTGNIYERKNSYQSSKKSGYGQKINLYKAVKAYRVKFLIWRDFLEFSYILFPIFMFSAYVVNVVCTYSVIKLHSELPVTLFAMLALMDVAVAGITVGIHKFAMVIVQQVSSFFYYWENELMSSLGRRYIRSCMLIKVNIGPFFHLEPSTLLNTFMQVADMTTTMLIA